MQVHFTDGRISLRPYQARDVDRLFAAASESIAELYPWMPWCHPAYSREESAAWLEAQAAAWAAGQEYNFAVVEAQSDAFLGGCGLNQLHRGHRFANLGYWVRTSRTRRGVATAAVRLLARFGFAQLQLVRLEIVVDIENRASLRVAEKAGAQREGVLRRRLFVHGAARDAVMYSLLPEDCPKGEE